MQRLRMLTGSNRAGVTKMHYTKKELAAWIRAALAEEIRAAIFARRIRGN